MKKLVLALTMLALPALLITSTSVNAADKVMNVSDVVVDINEYNGKEVSVKGFLLAAGGIMNFLYEKPGSMSFIALNFDSLDKASYKQALQKCGSGCANVTVKGSTTQEFGSIKMSVTAITF
jgi:hypothetical protein